MKKAEEKTLGYYNKHAKEWGEAHHGFEEESFWKDWMQKLHNLLSEGKILEVGSGTGKDASNLIKLGYDYTGTDASQGLLKIAQERNPNAVFKNIKAQDLHKLFGTDEFDCFWSAATLLHIPKDEINATLQSIHAVVKDGGIGFISIKQGEGEQEDETGRLFSYYSQEEFAELLKENGFEVIEKDIQPMSEKTIWLVYLIKIRKEI
ncbi:hypothetical protein A2872_00785 [Candidatus Gottesmanbacteria bacterium RIFCSPHIGHO2_01_FULL_42_12]|uniref:Methyltransferase domain-containing protein n=1 Tax=Candidatus Gottesmanbacteria bacterium RIFCSPHIGHO2_01_FULL_42_12 TaxID=1798377 RepID=A0A1F5Z445_9BACT|nr:MAG: hypothetical protein A2872_00785 [Candidatus Gottesmanbacteria bacterium RIFCSPHIGHO2_01_FULL_42_12]